LEVVKQLFAKEKRLKKPFLLVVEECHEYIPEGRDGRDGEDADQGGQARPETRPRHRRDQPAPGRRQKDFITQCDWLCWHRLTWDNDTKVVGRILGSKYASAVEDLGDGEAFLMTDWDESIRRIQFHRKQTFDAGATPGLDDFERPELKSVSSDLVGELQSISDEEERRESEIADLKQDLDKRDQRIQELERELEDARDLSNMADQFAQALLGKAEAPYRGGNGPSVRRRRRERLATTATSPCSSRTTRRSPRPREARTPTETPMSTQTPPRATATQPRTTPTPTPRPTTPRPARPQPTTRATAPRR